MQSRPQAKVFEPKLVRRNLICALIVSIIISSSFIIFSDSTEAKTFSTDIIEPNSAAIALGLSLLVVYRQKVDGLIGKVYASIAIGLALWFIAKVIWSYYEIGLGVEIPTPSPADIFWLIGYGPALYYILRMFKFSHKYPSRYHVIALSSVAAIYLSYIILATIDVSEFSTQNDIVKFFVNIAYPILDIIIIVPAALMILDSTRKVDGGRRGGGGGELVSIPWILLSFIIITIADSGFEYASNAGWTEEAIWVWNPFFITGYLVMAAGLFWHNRFFIFDEQKAIRCWQEKHR